MWRVMAVLAFRSWNCDHGVCALEGGVLGEMGAGKFVAEGCFSESSDKFMGV